MSQSLSSQGAVGGLLFFLSSSVGKKVFMAITGLSLCVFLVAHLSGNFLLIVGPEAFNRYAHFLMSQKAILYTAEAGLVLVFLMHLGLAMRLVRQNFAARPSKYFYKSKSGKGETFASQTMPLTGMVILVFVVLHLLHFKYGPYYAVVYDGVEMRDLHKLVMEYFSSLGATIWYVVAMLCLGLHLSHGFQSAFQSLGLNHERYNKMIKCLGKFYFVAVAVGFSGISIWAHLCGGQS